MTRDYLILYVNGRRLEIRGERAFQSLSDFLRYDLRLTGMKVVCAEGDCASCTVLVGRRSPQGAMVYCTVASCIQFLFQLDGTHIVTIEGLQYDGELNPVQEAMVCEHGAQCGFCTPGFVVSLHAMLENGAERDEAALRRGLVGNLCRCTGYEPILRAGLATDLSRMRRVDELYPPALIAEDFAAHATDAVEITVGAKHFLKPVTIDAATRFRAEHAGCAVVTGGTDYGVQVNKGLRTPEAILSTSALPGFFDHAIADGVWSIGGGVTLATLEREAARVLPQLAEMLDRFGSIQIRNAGTLAGNIANGSSIGDTLPLLFVLEAEIELAGPSETRRVKINDFFTGYRQNLMRGDELITRVYIPLPSKNDIVRLYKISKRRDLDISSFTAAFCLERTGDSIGNVRIAYGGVGPTVIRLPKTEAMLRGKPLTFDTFAAAADNVREEIAPISDVRGSADYRNLLAANILLKLAADLGFAPEDGNGQAHGPESDPIAGGQRPPV
ncbi:MAG: FAD binding domain-containing protein, partial [Chthoniobacterales bacterium]|nr:FAD binding domain-containing protein [Chthoniobacterales bacterium]